jgi:hypothetical protein
LPPKTIVRCSHCGREMERVNFDRTHRHLWDKDTNKWKETEKGLPYQPANRLAWCKSIRYGRNMYPEEHAPVEVPDAPAPANHVAVDIGPPPPDDLGDADPEDERPRPVWALLKLWASTYRIPHAAFTLLLNIISLFIAEEPLTVPDYSYGETNYAPAREAGAERPATLRTINSALNLHKDDFKTYVVCSGCGWLYTEKEASQTVTAADGSRSLVITRCGQTYWKYGKESSCNTPLVDAQTRVSGKGRATTTALPRHLFPYKSIGAQASAIVDRVGDLLDH